MGLYVHLVFFIFFGFETFRRVAAINAELLIVSFDKSIQIDRCDFELPWRQSFPPPFDVLLAMVDRIRQLFYEIGDVAELLATWLRRVKH